MRWACRCCSVACPCRRTMSMRTVKSRGPDTPTLVSRLRRRSRVAQATVAKKPGAPGRTRSSRSNHRAGNAGMSRLNLWYLPPASFSAGGPWGRPAPGIPRTLCLSRAQATSITRARHAARRRRHISTPSLRGAQATKQSRLSPLWDSGLLRFARNDVEFSRYSRSGSAPRARPGIPAQTRGGCGAADASAGGLCRSSRAQANPRATMTQAEASRVGCLPACTMPKP